MYLANLSVMDSPNKYRYINKGHSVNVKNFLDRRVTNYINEGHLINTGNF